MNEWVVVVMGKVSDIDIIFQSSVRNHDDNPYVKLFHSLLRLISRENLDCLDNRQYSGMRSLAFSLRDVTINVLTFSCLIPGMRNLAFSLRDDTIIALSCVFHIRFTLHVLLFVRDFEQ